MFTANNSGYRFSSPVKEQSSGPLALHNAQSSSSSSLRVKDRTKSVDRIRSSLSLKYATDGGADWNRDKQSDDDDDDDDVGDTAFLNRISSGRLFGNSVSTTRTTEANAQPFTLGGAGSSGSLRGSSASLRQRETAKASSYSDLPVSRMLQLEDSTNVYSPGSSSNAARGLGGGGALLFSNIKETGVKFVVTMMCWALARDETWRTIDDCTFLVEFPPQQTALIDPSISARELESKIRQKSATLPSSLSCKCTAHSLYLWKPQQHQQRTSISGATASQISTGGGERDGELIFISSFTTSVVSLLRRKAIGADGRHPEIYVFPSTVAGADI